MLVVVVAVGAAEVGVGVGLGVGDGEVSVGVGLGLGLGDGEVSVGDADGEVDAADGEVDAAAGEVEVVAAGADVDAVADGVADALTADKDSQDSLIPVAVAAVALPAMTAATPPEAAVNRAPPAINVAALRLPCAIKSPSHIDRYQGEISRAPRKSSTASLNQVGTVRGPLDTKPYI